MPSRARRQGAILAILLLGGATGCGASVSIGTPPTGGGSQPATRPTSISRAQAAALAGGLAQRPGTCKVAAAQVHFPTGEWTATETVLSTYSIDACAGEQLVRPWDFRRSCRGGTCKTYLYTASYYGISVAEVVPHGRGQYLATFRPSAVPCPHRPGEDTGTNEDRTTITLSWSPDQQTIHGLSREYQEGACGGTAPETSSYVVVRTDPSANPPRRRPVAPPVYCRVI